MKRTPLSRSTPLEPGHPPQRRTGLRSVSGRMTEDRNTASRTGNFPAAGRAVPARKKNAARGKAGSGRRESFPPDVAAQIDARDQWCVKCGSPEDLHHHHRRIKGIGGDGRDHTDCACNGVLLCLEHHAWAHSGKGRREAEAEGLIIPRSETAPWRRPLMVHTAADSGFTARPTCDGGWDYELEAGAA